MTNSKTKVTKSSKFGVTSTSWQTHTKVPSKLIFCDIKFALWTCCRISSKLSDQMNNCQMLWHSSNFNNFCFDKLFPYCVLKQFGHSFFGNDLILNHFERDSYLTSKFGIFFHENRTAKIDIFAFKNIKIVHRTIWRHLCSLQNELTSQSPV